jgi:hypothetical protein
MAGNILDMLSGLFGGGGAAGMATIPGANSNKMLGALGLGSMGRVTPDAPSMDDMYGELGEEVPEPKPRRARPAPRMGQPPQPLQPFLPDTQPLQPFGQNPFMEEYRPFGLEGPFGLEEAQPDFMPNPFGGEMDNDQRNAIIQLLKLLGR